MKLYYSPGACSLADHIALHEAKLAFEHERVDLKAKTTTSGADFTAINPKGYVPTLVLDSGETITENVAMLDWIASQESALGLDGPLGRTRLLETLAYISTEVHKSFKPMFSGGSDTEKNKAREMIAKRLQLLADGLHGDYLFGNRLSVADCYLFVMLLWSDKFDIVIPEPLPALRDRMLTRSAVQTAMKHEGLL
ncbi:MAG: glutathione S-transferase N-terminal domain-containing protein [Chroococcidiopsidaceae cyanobacterium CP_BM_ER_R8_30]|nr:glutathione S-transferase N-terminal domain-containing protein [Chroococcidiopsidaceae cyanobacterium CP_BM_ER_R8_30]